MYSRLTNISTNKNSRSAFTLIELLAVVTVIIILTGITFGISKGILNQQARAQAKAELAMIAQALEEFKLMYGDYPVVSKDDPIANSANAKRLTVALTGYAYLEPGSDPGTRSLTDVVDNDDDGQRDKKKSFIDTTRINLSKEFEEPTDTDIEDDLTTDSFLVDPWRQPYVYVYNRGSSVNDWENVGYVLFSKGPDKEATDLDVTTGTVGQTDPDGVNKDNIYPNQ